MSSPIDQIYEQASAGSAGGSKVGIGQSDLAPRESLFKPGTGQQAISQLFDQSMGSFNNQTHGIFDSAIQKAVSLLMKRDDNG
jgi:hypothetical protein